MKKVIIYLILSSLASTSYSQNWEQVGEKIKNWWGLNVLYTDTINDYLYVGGWFYYQKTQSTKGTFSLVRLKNGVEEVLDSVEFNKVYAIYPYQGDLYIGGDFENMGGRYVQDSTGKYILLGGKNTSGIARLHNDIFEAVNPIIDKSISIYSFTEHNGNLIIGGVFDSLSGIQSKAVMSYNGTKFTPLGTGVLQNKFAYVYALNTFKGKLYAGGNFYGLSKLNQVDATTNDFQVYSGGEWNREDGWLQNTSFGSITSMVTFEDELYIAGLFREQDGSLANNIIKYDGTYFYNLGRGTNNYINKMIVHNNELFICGAFDFVDGVNAQYLAKWNGKRWCSLSKDIFPNTIADLTFYRDTLHIFGGFDTISGKPISTLAKWIGNSRMEDSCATLAEIKKVNYNLGFSDIKITELKFRVYPNPTNDILTVEKLKNAGEFNYKLFDINGREIRKGMLLGTETNIDVSNIKSGIYILIINNGNEQISKRIRIE